MVTHASSPLARRLSADMVRPTTKLGQCCGFVLGYPRQGPLPARPHKRASADGTRWIRSPPHSWNSGMAIRSCAARKAATQPKLHVADTWIMTPLRRRSRRLKSSKSCWLLSFGARINNAAHKYPKLTVPRIRRHAPLRLPSRRQDCLLSDSKAPAAQKRAVAREPTIQAARPGRRLPRGVGCECGGRSVFCTPAA